LETYKKENNDEGSLLILRQVKFLEELLPLEANQLEDIFLNEIFESF
jgi:hypothetical protein